MMLEASGRFKTPDTLNPYFDQAGLKRVVVKGRHRGGS